VSREAIDLSICSICWGIPKEKLPFEVVPEQIGQQLKTSAGGSASALSLSKAAQAFRSPAFQCFRI
jgi:hypothetical protein